MSLYKTARWQRMRLTHLSARPLCVMCMEEGRVQSGNVVDHIIPHRGDLTLFYDETNFQTLCKRHHDGAKQRAEKGGRSGAVSFDGTPEGW